MKIFICNDCGTVLLEPFCTCCNGKNVEEVEPETPALVKVWDCPACGNQFNPEGNSMVRCVCGTVLQVEEDRWINEFPEEEGSFWFHGYRHGKVSVGQQEKPILLFVKVIKNGVGGFTYVADGKFMLKSEVEEARFKKATLPEIPTQIEQGGSDDETK